MDSSKSNSLEVQRHLMIVGTSGRGRVLFHGAPATPESRPPKPPGVKRTPRLDLVCEAMWPDAGMPDSETARLCDVLSVTGVAANPSPAQVRALVMALPQNLIGQAISWGFDDTEVGEAVYAFVDKHFEEVAARVRQADS